MDNPAAVPIALPDDNTAARQFALALSEEDLFQYGQGQYVPMFAYPPERHTVWIKFGGPEKQAEADMQRLAYDWLKRINCGIHVPEVFKVFSRDGVTFIIMQLVHAKMVREFAHQFGDAIWEDQNLKAGFYDMIVQGIQLLRQMPVPTNATPGPYTSSKRIIRHRLFKDSQAPIVYETVQELESHLNRVAQQGYRRNPSPPTVTLEKELAFCYTDFNDENFMFATGADGRPRLYILDFEHASFLPTNFLSFAVFERGSRRWFLCPWIRDRIGDTLPQDNIVVWERIFYMFQVSGWTIGLTDEQIEHNR